MSDPQIPIQGAGEVYAQICEPCHRDSAKMF